jgi:hypothetical protein
MMIRLRTFGYAARAIWRKIVRIVLRRPLVVCEHEQKRRLDICHSCGLRSGKQCSLCTCYINLKTLFIDEYCPARPPKW